MTAIVSIQLLRLGLVNHTTDGNTYQKEEKDVMLLVALADAGFEILICFVSSIVSCRMAKAAKKELFQKRAACFHVQVLGPKDIEVVVSKKEKKKRQASCTPL